MNSYSQIKSLADYIKTQTYNRAVLVTGCFDVIHIGHAKLLEFADSQGTVLVGVNSDSSVRKLKGPSRPVNNQVDRMELLRYFNTVYFVFLIEEETVTESILKIKPDVWVKGSDYTLETLNQDERKAAESVGAKIIFAPKVEGYSSTKIIEKLKQ